MPKGDYFSKALYTLDIGQNDLAKGFFFGNMNIEEVNASIPDIVNKFSINVKVNLYLYWLVVDNGLAWPRPITTRSNILLLNQLQPKNKFKKKWNLVTKFCFISANHVKLWCRIYITWEQDRFGSTTRDQLAAFSLFWTIFHQLKGTVMVAQSLISYNDVAQYFNHKLKEDIVQLRKDLPSAAFTYVDVYSLKYSLFRLCLNSFYFLSTYFTIQLIFVTIYRSYCNFWYYSWVSLYYFS